MARSHPCWTGHLDGPKMTRLKWEGLDPTSQKAWT